MWVKLMHQTNNFWPTPLGLIQKDLWWIASNTKVTAAFWYSLEVLHRHMLPHNILNVTRNRFTCLANLRGLQWELFKPDTYRTITYTEYKRCHMIICQVPVIRQLFPQQTFKISLSSLESSTKSSKWTTGKWCASTSRWLDLLSEHTHFSPTRALGLRSLDLHLSQGIENSIYDTLEWPYQLKAPALVSERLVPLQHCSGFPRDYLGFIVLQHTVRMKLRTSAYCFTMGSPKQRMPRIGGKETIGWNSSGSGTKTALNAQPILKCGLWNQESKWSMDESEFKQPCWAC